MSSLDWMDNAACKGTDPNQWFDERRVRELREQYCEDCPVKILCKWYAINKRMVGVWGGRTTKSRDAVAAMYSLPLADSD